MPSEKEIMSEAVNHPGFKLIMEKLVDSAERVQAKYDTDESFKEFKKHQIYRSVVLKQIPKVIESIINKGEKPPLWKFWQWLGNL